MAISNCLFSPTLEIPTEFPTWCVLTELSANPFNYLSPKSLALIKFKYEKEVFQFRRSIHS